MAPSAARNPQPMPAPTVVATPTPTRNFSRRRSIAAYGASCAIFFVQLGGRFQDVAETDAKAQKAEDDREQRKRVQPAIEQIAYAPGNQRRDDQRERQGVCEGG